MYKYISYFTPFHTTSFLSIRHKEIEEEKNCVYTVLQAATDGAGT